MKPKPRKQSVHASPDLHAWSPDALLAKAQLYAEEMDSYENDEWQFGFWSALTLEMLGRAALASISPGLLADPKDWKNLYFALGYTPKASRFSPRSIAVATVFSLLREVIESFDSSLANFATAHLAKRNEELHSGNTAFHGIASSSWLPTYYETCDVLLKAIDSSLLKFFGEDIEKAALAMIAAAKDESAKAVISAIQAHKTVWNQRTEKDREKASAQASVWAARHEGHRVACPACNSTAMLLGTPLSPPTKTLKDDQIVETQQYLPSRFECIACGLKIAGLSQLHAAGVGDTFKVTRTFEAVDYYAPEEEFDGYEDDNNEW